MNEIDRLIDRQAGRQYFISYQRLKLLPLHRLIHSYVTTPPQHIFLCHSQKLNLHSIFYLPSYPGSIPHHTNFVLLQTITQARLQKAHSYHSYQIYFYSRHLAVSLLQSKFALTAIPNRYYFLQLEWHHQHISTTEAFISLQDSDSFSILSLISPKTPPINTFNNRCGMNILASYQHCPSSCLHISKLLSKP